MQSLVRVGCALVLLSAGYVMGTLGLLSPSSSKAQPNAAPVSDETTKRLKSAYAGVNAAMIDLQQQNMYVPAIKGVNSFAVTIGGLDAVNDLETTGAVDPETFAGLYADQAVDEVAAHLARDDQGRLTYKGKVVQMYPIFRLKQMFEARNDLGTKE